MPEPTCPRCGVVLLSMNRPTFTDWWCHVCNSLVRPRPAEESKPPARGGGNDA